MSLKSLCNAKEICGSIPGLSDLLSAALAGFGEGVLDALSDPHLVLDGAGMIPGVGIMFDGANGVLYLVEGDTLNASLSGLAMIPAVGQGATALKPAGSNSVEFVTVYRVFGGDSRALGQSWTTVDPRGVDDIRGGLGLPSGGTSGYNNTADFMVQDKVKASDISSSHPADPLDGNPGGLPEVVIHNPADTVELTDFDILNP